MNTEQIFALMLFATVSSITPGPNNMMMLASGVNFGVRRSLWHWLGIGLGFAVMLLSMGLGLQVLLDRWPWIYQVLRWGGAVYMLYLACRIATATAPQAESGSGSSSSPASSASGAAAGVATDDAAGRPLGFWQAAAFQWVNPKAMVMAITAINTYLPPAAGILPLLLLTVIFTLINLPCVGCWAVFGSAMRNWLQDPHHRRVFNGVMAAGLVLSLYPLVTSMGD